MALPVKVPATLLLAVQRLHADAHDDDDDDDDDYDNNEEEEEPTTALGVLLGSRTPLALWGLLRTEQELCVILFDLVIIIDR